MKLILGLFFLFSIACTKKSNMEVKVANELINLCEWANNLDASFFTQDPAIIAAEYVKAQDSILKSDSLKNMMSAVREVEKSQAWGLIQKGASEAGYPNFKCPQLEVFYK